MISKKAKQNNMGAGLGLNVANGIYMNSRRGLQFHLHPNLWN